MASYEWGNLKAVWSDEDRYAAYYREALEHAGLTFSRPERLTGQELAGCSTLLLCGVGNLSNAELQVVQNFVGGGGAVVASGSTWGLEELLGLAREGVHQSNAILKPEQEDRLWAEGASQARFFGGMVHPAKSAKVIATTPAGPAVTRHRPGRGLALYVAPHVGQTFGLMALGRSVETDGIGPSDGSARLDDGLLRAEDGIALDFERDRSRIRDSAPFFATPHADIVREVWIRAVMEALEFGHTAAPVLWHWPRGAPAVATLTIDCETFDPDQVSRIQRTFTMFGCQPAWLVGQPGYPLDVYRALRSWDHEVGLLFTTDDQIGWHEERLKIQVVSVTRASTSPALVTIRPADGRWRGWTAFYEMAEAAGARVSVSKGGRQPGTAGFPFGTCHPFFPLKSHGASSLVMELPYAAYLPSLVTPDPVADALLAQSVRRNGCFHVAWRPEAIDEPAAINSLRRLLGLCRQMRVPFFRPDEIHRHERGRRSLRSFMTSNSEGASLSLASEQGLEGLTVLLPGAIDEVLVRGRVANTRPFEAYGTSFTAVDLNLEPRQLAEIRVLGEVKKAA